MLGRQVLLHLKTSGLDVAGTYRSPGDYPQEDNHLLLDVVSFSETLFEEADRPDWVINCIGVIKSRINSPADKATAVAVNSAFPHQLDQASEKFGFRVIQIATDCVYSGADGQYTENSPHSPTDIYGMSKSLGEVDSPRFLNLRCSIIGPERKGHSSLLEWVRSRPGGASIPGYVNHVWNGITTLAFAKVVLGIIRNNLFQGGTFHLVPRDVVTKDQLVRLIASRLGRDDLSVQSVAAEKLVERSLNTLFPSTNERLWHYAGYSEIPTIQELVKECPVE